MRPLWLLRRLTNGLPCVLLAGLLLFARSVAPAAAMPTGMGDRLSQTAICHTGTPGEAPAPTDHSSQHDCLICLACHFASPAVLPTSAAPGLLLPTVLAIGLAAPLPPATGPPSLVQTTAQPTGPPRFSA